jgi:hypothetical protein
MASLRIPVFAIVAACNAQDGPTLAEHKEGKAAEKADAEASAANQAKMAAVNKVITMLEDLQAQVLHEGEKEAKSYNEFACFCKDMTSEKSDAITKGTDDKTSISSTIADLNEKRDQYDDTIQELTTEIEEAEGEMKESAKERKATLTVYEKNEADLAGALEALKNAIDVLKASKKPSLAQVQSVAKTVRAASLMADALGLGGAETQRVAAMFLQQDPEVPMEDYKFKSGSVIETLEKLQDDFRAQKNELDAAEVKSVAEHDAFMQEKGDFVKAKNNALDDTKKEKDKTAQSIALNTEQLTTVSADLLDNQQYLKELSELCSSKAKTWDQRTKVRSDELSALTAATAIIKDSVAEKTSSATIRFAQAGVRVRLAHAVAKSDDAMESLEAAAEAVEGPVAFLQRKSSRSLLSVLAHKAAPHDDARQAVLSMLNSQGQKFKSTLLTGLASQISADPMAKVKKLIQDLIERLLAEAADEANQKGWCDKAQGEAKQKRRNAVEAVAELNGQMAELEATTSKLREELEILSGSIAELEEKQEEATKMRKEEKSENNVNVMEATAGLEAVEQAIDILDKFYKTAAKEGVNLELVQKGPLDDAPDAGFDSGEAYTGAGGESGGILGMLDVIKSDFERTISMTEKAEASAEQEYMSFMTESGKSLAEKNMAHEQKTKQKDSAIEEYESANDDLESQTALLRLSIKTLLELKPTCVDTGMSYEERVARREDEIESLKKALCIFQNFDDIENAGC